MKLYVCPAYDFVFTPAEEASCELSLVNTNVEVVIKKCKFESIEIRSVFHAHMNARQYFYFPNKTDVTLTCDKRPSYLTAFGYYTAPDFCEVRASTLLTLPSRQHLPFTTNLTTGLSEIVNFLNVILGNISIVSDKIKFLSYLNDSSFSTIVNSSLTFYMKPRVFLPSTLITIVLIFLSVCVLAFCLKRVASRYEVKKKVKKPRSKVKANQIEDETLRTIE